MRRREPQPVTMIVSEETLNRSRIHNMRTLFNGRTDAYGGDEGRAIWEPYTTQVVERHLNGIEGCGAYPVLDNMVKWGCCDIDTGDWNEAYMLATALRGMGLNPWIERSRSKGWHIWIFAPYWIPAADMRRCLKVAYAAIDLPAKEANPKSESLRPNQLGNYVRLPYKGGLIIDPERQCMMRHWGKHGDGCPLTFRQFIDGKNVPLDDEWGTGEWVHPGFYSPIPKIQEWASKWFERPKRLDVSTETLPDDEVAKLMMRFSPATAGVVFGGPKTADRSATLQALAHMMARMNFKPIECLSVIAYADRRWGKYHLRADGEAYLIDIVERAYR